jgi:hypothetical protein
MECMAILGRREVPTDGVHDHCCYLRDALANDGVTLTLTQVRWAEIGRQELLEAIKGKQNALFLLQHGVVIVAARICVACCGHSEIIKKRMAHDA